MTGLISASSDIAERVELHTHIEDANGVMRMVEIEDGFAMEAGETIMLQRGRHACDVPGPASAVGTWG